MRNSEVEDLTRNIVTCDMKSYVGADNLGKIDGKYKIVEN